MKLKQLFIATLCTIIGMTCAAQNFGGDTIALFDFNNPATQIASGTGEFHTQTAYASTWRRVPGLHYINDSSFQSNYSTYVFPYVSQYFEEYMDSAFMLMSMWDGTVSGQHYEAWFEIGPIDASQVPMVEVRLQQIYRKYYDSCFVDYTDANGEWHSMQINITGVDVNVNSWAPTTYSFTFPSDAAYNGQLMLRFRYKDRDWNGAAGYAWAVDNVAICRGRTNNLQFYDEHYVEGFYGQIPQGLQTPISWWTQVKNKGSITHSNVVASLMNVDADDNQIDIITSVSQPDIVPGTQPVSLIIEGQDNIAAYDGNHAYSSYYGQTGTVDNNAGLGTATPGINRVAAMVSTDSTSMQYTSYIYKVTTPDTDGIYTWGLDNGLLLSGHAYKSGYIFNADYNTWYTTNESENYNLAGYSVLNRYSTGSNVPVDAYGQPWVIRGIEVVPAAGPEASQYVGAVLSAKVYEEYTEEGSWGTSTVTTGSASYTVQASDINTQYGAMETGYNTVRIMFPEQVTLEPNKCYYAGYRLDNDHEFAAAAMGTSWMDADGVIHSVWDDSLLADYGNIVANTYYNNEVYDPAYGRWNTYNDNAAMVRLLVGPRVEVAYHTLALNSDDGYIALNGTENWYGSPTFSLAEGSYITGKFVPSYGFTLDSANITVAGNAVIYYEGGYWWFRIDNLNSDVYISAHYTSAFPATCQKQVPYSISQGDNWIDDCWETYNDEDSTMVYFSSSIRSPFISLPNNSDTYVVNLTVDNTATGVDEVVVYVLNQRNTFSIYRLLPLSSATVNQLSFIINDPQLHGNTIYFQIYFPAYSDYLMTLTDFSIATLNGIDTAQFNMVTLPYGPRASNGDFASWTLEGGAELTANGCIKLSAPGQVAYSPWFVLSDSVAKLHYRPFITRGTSDSVDYWQDYGDCVGLFYGLDSYFAGQWMPSAGSSICNIIMSDGSWFETQNHLGRIVRWKYEYRNYGSNDSLFLHALNLFEYDIYTTLYAPNVVTAGQPVDLSLTYSTSDNDTTDMSFYWSTYTNDWSFYESMGSGQNITYIWETPGTYTLEVYAHKNNVFNGMDAAAYATTTVIVTEGDSTYTPNYIANLTPVIDTIETNSDRGSFYLELDTIPDPAITWDFEGAIEESIGSDFYVTVSGGSVSDGWAAWSQPGTYAVTATFRVNGSTDSRTTYITVVEPCHVSDYPYTTDFENGMNCWKPMYGLATLEDGTVRLSGANFGWIKSPVLDRGEGEYQISFRAKSSVTTPQHLGLYMYHNTFHDLMNNAVSEEFDVSSTDWTNYTFTIPANAERINFGYYDQGNGDVWIDDIVISLVDSNVGDSTVTIVDTVYRDTVIYNITYLDSTVLNILTIDSVVYNITNRDSVVYNINTVDSVVVNIIQSDSVIYFYDTTCVTHDTITLTEYLHDTITVTLHDTITITVHDTVYIHDSVGLDPVSALPITINVSGGAIVVDGAEGRNVQLYDAVGRLIATRQNYAGPVRFDIAASGTYLVKVDGYPARKVVAVR